MVGHIADWADELQAMDRGHDSTLSQVVAVRQITRDAAKWAVGPNDREEVEN